MPTNDERRKIAAELRENRDPLTPYNLVDYIFDDPWNHNSGEEVAARLADLIEPEPEERTCHNLGTYGGFECSMCGFKEEQLSEMECEPQDWCFCPSCGAKVVEQ